MKDPAKQNEDAAEYHEERAEDAPNSASAEYHQERADDRRGLATTYANKAKSKRILVDFDGVLSVYQSKYDSTNIPDPPVPESLVWLEAIEAAGLEPVIFTTRAGDGEKAIETIRQWLKKYGFPNWNKIQITDKKIPANIYLDDRAIQFRGTFPTIDQLLTFAPWNKK